MNILGVRVDEYTKEEALLKVLAFLRDGKQHTIFTPNPEMLVDAQNDEQFRNILNSGSLNICDGVGIELVSGGKLKRISGVDFMQDICRLAAKEEKRVYVLGSLDDTVLQKTKTFLEKQFPGLQICGMDPGDGTVEHIRAAVPDILFVAFGHPKQEKWIHENLAKLPSVKISMGVGGACDMLAGKTPRAPRFLRAIGLEWLWRLLIEPRRIRRIWKATGAFLFLFFTKK
jgi:N-acetylglucosaminyldiphosphoundecaprenol N-acetyl-beta-D-mannosaminyltransferase